MIILLIFALVIFASLFISLPVAKNVKPSKKSYMIRKFADGTYGAFYGDAEYCGRIGERRKTLAMAQKDIAISKAHRKAKEKRMKVVKVIKIL